MLWFSYNYVLAIVEGTFAEKEKQDVFPDGIPTQPTTRGPGLLWYRYLHRSIEECNKTRSTPRQFTGVLATRKVERIGRNPPLPSNYKTAALPLC